MMYMFRNYYCTFVQYINLDILDFFRIIHMGVIKVNKKCMCTYTVPAIMPVAVIMMEMR